MSEMYLTPERKNALDAEFQAVFARMPERYFSAPGRTEIGGNHTDHQRGRVLAAAVDLETVAAVAYSGTDTIRFYSKGYGLCEVKITETEPVEEEKNTTAALIRGMTAAFAGAGCPLGGFDAYCESTVLPGSGLSSSAAFEVLVGTVLNALFGESRFSAREIAQMGQRAENVYFGKPCGLMDQMASAVGNLVSIDFREKDAPCVRQVEFDFASCGYALCIVDSGGNHAELTNKYASITREMAMVSAWFGKTVLSEVSEEAFFADLPALRKSCGDRAVLRAMHFYGENRRVLQQTEALEQGDFEGFLNLVRQSGRSSYMYLQNVIPRGSAEQQELALSLALCERYLEGRGACRVHGGGFSGTVQAFVPLDLLERFVNGVEAVLGCGACHVLKIRSCGGVELKTV